MKARLSDQGWRIVWEEHLDDAARRRVKRAIWRGEALSDPDEAAVAVERALRTRQGVKWTVLSNMLGYLILIATMFYLVDLPANSSFWWLVGSYSLVTAISPIAGWLRARQLDRAIAANRAAGTAG